MRLRNVLALGGTIALFAVPVAAADRPRSDVVASAKGDIHWTIPEPNQFGGVVEIRELDFNVRKHADGNVKGRFSYHQVFQGEHYKFKFDATCMGIYDGNRAKIGGVVTKSNDATVPPGTFGWFQVFDLGRGGDDDDDEGDDGEGVAGPDRSSLVGFGDEAANEAFCNSPNLPRFGPWDVHGDVRIRA